MNPWLFCQMLAAVLSLVAPDPSAEECKALITPLSLADPSVVLGKFNLIMGYTDSHALNDMLKVTKSSWVNMTSQDGHVVMDEAININGTCFEISVNVTMEDDIATIAVADVSSEYHLLPSSNGSFSISGKTTARNLKEIFKAFKIDSHPEDEVTARVLYVYGEDVKMKDSDLDYFRKQASCLGFSREPDFLYDPDEGVCQEGEGVRMPA